MLDPLLRTILAYFGFPVHGCVCSAVGTNPIQNAGREKSYDLFSANCDTFFFTLLPRHVLRRGSFIFANQFRFPCFVILFRRRSGFNKSGDLLWLEGLENEIRLI